MTKLIHIGYPKAASTSLQDYFADVGGVQFLGKRNQSYSSARLSRLHRKVIPLPEKQPFFWRATRLRFEAILQKLGVGDHYIVSDEVLSGVSFRYFRRTTLSAGDAVRVLKKVHGSDAHFLVVFREQKALLRSYYRQLLVHRYPFSFSHFIARQLEGGSAESISGRLMYSRVIEELRRASPNLHVFLFEEIVRDTRPIQELLRQCGFQPGNGVLSQRNASEGSELLVGRLVKNRRKVDRRYDKAAVEADEEAFRHACSEHPLWLAPSASEQLDALFADDNRRLGTLLGKDLAHLGYATSAP